MPVTVKVQGDSAGLKQSLNQSVKDAAQAREKIQKGASLGVGGLVGGALLGGPTGAVLGILDQQLGVTTAITDMLKQGVAAVDDATFGFRLHNEALKESADLSAKIQATAKSRENTYQSTLASIRIERTLLQQGEEAAKREQMTLQGIVGWRQNHLIAEMKLNQQIKDRLDLEREEAKQLQANAQRQADMIADLERQLGTFAMTANQIKQLEFNKNMGLGELFDEGKLAQFKGMMQQLERMENQKQVVADIQKPLEVFREQFAKLEKMFALGDIDEGQFAAAANKVLNSIRGSALQVQLPRALQANTGASVSAMNQFRAGGVFDKNNDPAAIIKQAEKEQAARDEKQLRELKEIRKALVGEPPDKL